MIIKNASVFTNDCCFLDKDIFIEGEKLSDATTDSSVLDGSGCYLIPGLMDIHFHGCVGYDFCDASIESLLQMAEYELKNGITSICPASMTLDKDTLLSICENAVNYAYAASVTQGARLCGFNLEGPFISPNKRGAQNPAYITTPDIGMMNELLSASKGLAKLITIAPETEGALPFIKEFADVIRISIGHTSCDYEMAKAAFLAGAKHMTHLYNAMPPLHHRHPGPIAAGMENTSVTAEIICDGIHVAPAAVRAAFALFGKDRMIFISDSMMAAGMPNGEYTLGGLRVHVTGKLATLDDGTIAGSATNLMDCMRNAINTMQIPLETAVRCCTINPAKAIGEDKEYGSIKTGKFADLVLLEKDTLAIRHVILHGKVVS